MKGEGHLYTGGVSTDLSTKGAKKAEKKKSNFILTWLTKQIKLS